MRPSPCLLVAMLAMLAGPAYASPEGANALARPPRPSSTASAPRTAPNHRAIPEASVAVAPPERPPEVEFEPRPPRPVGELYLEGALPYAAGGRLRVFAGRILFLDTGYGRGTFGGLYAFGAERAGAGDLGPILARVMGGIDALDLRLGIRPFRRLPVETTVGVGGFVANDAVPGDELSRAIDQELDFDHFLSRLTVRYVSTEIAYAAPLGRRLVLRFALSYLRVRSVVADFSAPGSTDETMGPALDAAESSVRSLLLRHGHLPTIGLALGTRLGPVERR